MIIQRARNNGAKYFRHHPLFSWPHKAEKEMKNSEISCHKERVAGLRNLP